MSRPAEQYRSTRRLWVVSGACFAVVAGIVIYRLLAHETLEQAARRLDGCLLSNNAGCVFRYAHPLETEALQLTPEKLQSFLDTYFITELRGFEPIGDLEFEYSKPGSPLDLQSVRKMRHPDGREIALVFRFHMGDDGPIGEHIVTALIVRSCYAMQNASEKKAAGMDKFRLLRDCFVKFGPTWQKAGIKGYTDTPIKGGSGLVRLVPFEAAINRTNARLERIEQEKRLIEGVK